ncbi:acyl carrier protein [Paenibacillus sp. SYP-B4298]|uniref:acyl carrier protein n=1 Tax=Paenibacillus sp. SYP-B4298 TaxID=2996034 RepID=UPI0022DDF2B1|nr:acyl carrier protein [Paenibacillus sp. SYP-B4298]
MEIDERIKPCITGIFRHRIEVDEQTNLLKVGVDSINFIRIVVALEEEFDIEIMDAAVKLDNFTSLPRIRSLIAGYLEQRGAGNE